MAALVAWQREELGPLLAGRGAEPGKAGRAVGRLVGEGSLHITLAFLGERPAAEVPLIMAAVREAAVVAVPPRLEVEGYRETAAVGMLVLSDEGGRAAALAGDVQERLATLGVFSPERRPWLPHVTVARFRRRPRLSPRPPSIGPCMPSDAALYHSSLRSGGAQYAVVDSVALGGNH